MPETEEVPVEERVEVAGRSVSLLRGGAGDPLLLLHHSTGSRGWEELADALAGSVSVLAPDLPGYGRSERPEWARSPRDVGILMGRLIDHLELPSVHLVGMGFGGWVAAEMATMAPRRFATLTLVGAAGIRPREGEIVDQMLIDYDKYLRLGFSNAASFDAVFGAEPDKAVVELWDFSREMTARLTWKPWMFSRQLPFFLREVPIPALVVWGADDRIIPVDCGRQYADLLPNARLEVVEGAGHFVDLEAPAQLAELITDHVRQSGLLADAAGTSTRAG